MVLAITTRQNVFSVVDSSALAHAISLIMLKTSVSGGWIATRQMANHLLMVHLERQIGQMGPEFPMSVRLFVASYLID
jgi:hypothetical protein